MYTIKGINNQGRNLTEDEIAAFCALEKDTISKLIPDEQFFDYVVNKTPQNTYRIMVSYREVSLMTYLLDPRYGVHKMSKAWQADMQLFIVKALYTTITNGILLNSKEIEYMHKILSSYDLSAPIVQEVLRVAFYLPPRLKDQFDTAARMAAYKA